MPLVRNAFVGREAALREVVRRLAAPDARLVTLAGRGGVGKTRLALEVARRVGGGFPGGAVLLEVPLAEHGDVVDLVASALELRVAPGQPARDAVERRLDLAPGLLIADDADAIDGALDALVALVATAPGVRILATARRPTGHPEEQSILLRPLEVPSEHADPATIRATAAVALYLARATASNPSFVPRDEDLATVAEVCRRLDGLPLAIELGAARARILSPEGQLRALDEGAPLDLRAPRGDRRPERHQDLRRTIEATWALTSDPERAVLRRMAVFAAPPDLPLLRAVVVDRDVPVADVLDALGSLVDLGLVDADVGGGEEATYRLLPTIRGFGLEQLEAAGETARIQRAYEDAFLELARGTWTLPEPAKVATLAAVAPDLAAVLARLEAGGRLPEALDLASILATLWTRMGVSSAATATLERLLAAADAPGSDVPPAIHARGLVAAVVVAIEGRSVAEARERVPGRLTRALALAREGGEPQAMLQALEWSALGLVITGDVAGSAAANVEGLALATELDDPSRTRFEYRASMFAGIAGDTPTAVAFGAAALRRAAAYGDLESYVRTAAHLQTLPADAPGMPADLPTIDEVHAMARDGGLLFEEGSLYGRVAFQRLVAGDIPGAARGCLGGYAFAREHGAWYIASMSSVALLLVAAAVRDLPAVARLHGVLAPTLQESLNSLPPAALAAFQQAVAGTKAVLGEEAFAALEAETRDLDRDSGIDWAARYATTLAGEAPARSGGGDPAPAPPASGAAADRLTPRELDVLRVLASGATNRQAGERLGMTAKTVMHHAASIYAKLGVRGRSEATAWAYRHGLAEELER